MPPTATTASDRYTAASGMGSAIEEAALQYGLDIAPICDALDIDHAEFSNLTGRISLDRLCRLLETCALLTKDEAFGLKCVDYFKPGATGPYGFGLISAPTALDFFRFMAEHNAYVSEKSYYRVTIDAASAEVVWTFSPLIVKHDQFVDLNMALTTARLRSILGPAIDALEIGMERQKPANLAPYRERLTRHVQYARKVNSLRLPADYFGIANPKGDKRLFQLMDLQCRTLRPEASGRSEFSDDLREFVLQNIADSGVGLAEAAKYFHISERTLQRRLAEAGTNLADLRDDVRRELAARLLKETDLSAAEIATRLGYSQPSAFTRSTMRWFGASPRAYRRNAG
ncbi:MAG: AraC family transcriptional regulator ligand-binding domain-containing protein [Rhizobiaceae bacterium]|nr:AraC family transcriptional regulator ligand-binding domain-containing protein [Rhizobiaceae bacterium]